MKQSSRPQPTDKQTEWTGWENDIVAEADANDVFVIVEEQPKFEVLGLVRESETVAVTFPGKGESSQTFTVVAAGDNQPAKPPESVVQLPEGFRAVRQAGYSESGLPLRIVCLKDDSVMALIPAGFFLLGKQGGPPDADPELTVHLDAYYIDLTEVTLEQYEKHREEIKKTKGRLRREPMNASAPQNHPVLGLSWGDARFYARWAGKDLPTEAEWEKAARGESGFDFPWGNGRAVWSGSRLRNQIDPVGSFRTDMSPFGVYDLAGNAREWCLDLYSEQAFQLAAGQKELRNWMGPKTASQKSHRVVKGAGPSWAAWHRSHLNMSERAANVGFRCVLRSLANAESTSKQ